MMVGTILLVAFGGWEILLIAMVILIFFGAKRIPDLAKGIGRGIKEFKSATKEEEGKKNEEDKEETKRIDG